MVRKKLELSTHVYWQLATMKCKYDGELSQYCCAAMLWKRWLNTDKNFGQKIFDETTVTERSLKIVMMGTLLSTEDLNGTFARL